MLHDEGELLIVLERALQSHSIDGAALVPPRRQGGKSINFSLRMASSGKSQSQQIYDLIIRSPTRRSNNLENCFNLDERIPR
jgi:hypothetical protein